MMTADGGAQAGELIEQLAAIEHERWSSWQRWMHDQCVRDDDGSLTIPAGLVSRWERQIDTPYTDLSEREQESDREQVRRYWPLIEAIINERDALAAQVAALTAERDALAERCKPTEPPYLPCLWHETIDDTCPWCLRHALTQLWAAARIYRTSEISRTFSEDHMARHGRARETLDVLINALAPDTSAFSLSATTPPAGAQGE